MCYVLCVYLKEKKKLVLKDYEWKSFNFLDYRQHTRKSDLEGSKMSEMRSFGARKNARCTTICTLSVFSSEE